MNYQTLNGKSIREGFDKFIIQNPHIFAAFEQETLAAINAGQKKVNAKLVINTLRGRPDLQSKDQNFQINDAYQSYFPRLFVEKYPQYKDRFNFRRQRNEQPGPYMIVEPDGKLSFTPDQKTEPMDLTKANNAAIRILNILAPHCEDGRCFIAGSTRRGKPENIKDVEIVCQPKTEVIQTDLFGRAERITLPDFVKAIAALHTGSGEIKGSPTGRYCKRWFGEIQVDIFMPQPHDFFRQLVIRTGSADWVKSHIALVWSKLGWVGTVDGLRLRSECERDASDTKWKCVVKNPMLPPIWKSEQDFFAWMGIDWVDPKDRV